MEKPSTNTEISTRNTEKKMSDVALARGLIRHIGGDCWDGKSDMLERVYRSLNQHLPKELANRWTRRRLKAFWAREAAGVRFHEMCELAHVAQKAATRRAEIEEARKAHAEYVEKTANIAALLEHTDPDFHCLDVEGLRGVSSRVDSSGDSPTKE